MADTVVPSSRPGRRRGTQVVDAFNTSWLVVDSALSMEVTEKEDAGWFYGVSPRGQQVALRKTATPKPGTVVEVTGAPCTQATALSYPLYAECNHCEKGIRCMDGTAEWHHVSDYRGACSQ